MNGVFGCAWCRVAVVRMCGSESSRVDRHAQGTAWCIFGTCHPALYIRSTEGMSGVRRLVPLSCQPPAPKRWWAVFDVSHQRLVTKYARVLRFVRGLMWVSCGCSQMTQKSSQCEEDEESADGAVLRLASAIPFLDRLLSFSLRASICFSKCGAFRL